MLARSLLLILYFLFLVSVTNIVCIICLFCLHFIPLHCGECNAVSASTWHTMSSMFSVFERARALARLHMRDRCQIFYTKLLVLQFKAKNDMKEIGGMSVSPQSLWCMHRRMQSAKCLHTIRSMYSLFVERNEERGEWHEHN